MLVSFILVIFSLLVFLLSHRRLHRLPPVSRPCGRHYIRVSLSALLVAFFWVSFFWISITKGSLSTIAVWVFFFLLHLFPLRSFTRTCATLNVLDIIIAVNRHIIIIVNLNN